jgi:arginase
MFFNKVNTISAKIIFNNIKCMIGQKKKGVELGGKYILNKLKISSDNTIKINKLQDYSKIHNIILKNITLNPSNFIINLGGDHSISSATIKPLIDMYKDDLLLIWIDAHADINTQKSSMSGNKHGMPVATLMGTSKCWYTYKLSQDSHYLNPNNIIYVGTRDLDPYEVYFIKKNKIKLYSNYTEDIIETIKSHPAKYIHISFDIDSMDPSLMPSTGTKVLNGLQLLNLLDIIESTKDRLISFDLVEFNPYIGTSADVMKTLFNIKIILNKIFSINK